MKKILLLVLVLGTFSLSSCRSGWNCKKRYTINKSYNLKSLLINRGF